MSRRWAWLLLLLVPLGVALADLAHVSALSGSQPPATPTLPAEEARSFWLSCVVVVQRSDGARKSMELDVLARPDAGKWQVRALVREPQTVAGTEFLVLPQLGEMAIYLPAFKRLNHVAGDGWKGSLLGTDLRFEDLLDPTLWTEGGADDRVLERSGTLVLDGVELPAEIHVRNLAKGTSTIVRVLGGAVDEDLPDEWFTTDHLGIDLPRPPLATR